MSGVPPQHDNRILHQSGEVCDNGHIKEITITNRPPIWIKEKNDKYELVWTLDVTASEECRILVKCKCRNEDAVYSCLGCC